jgi:hypothetical protein
VADRDSRSGHKAIIKVLDFGPVRRGTRFRII